MRFNFWMISGLLLMATTGSACSCGNARGDRQDGGSTDGSVLVGQPPTVTLSAPATGSNFPSGATIRFQGSATDPEDGALAADALVWTSDVDGQIGIGATVDSGLTTLGAQRITLTATDSDGNTGSATVDITIVTADAPVVTITAPADGFEAAVGEPMGFGATIIPTAGSTIPSSQVVWSSDLDGQIGIGETIRTGLATTGRHTITCTATDDQGNVGSDSITVSVVTNRAPLVTIRTPGDNAFFTPNATITFNGSAADPEDGPINGASLIWSSDRSGRIGIGNPVITGLPLGDHLISLNATDSQGAVGEATITVHIVDNLPPVCTITRPVANDRFLEGQGIDFRGSCRDPETGPLTTGLTWTSDLDGQLGLGASIRTALPSLGDHRISLCATDPTNAALTGCGTVSITVLANTPPSCSITEPIDGAIISVGVQTRFVGTLTDAEDPALTGQRVAAAWSDDLGNPLSAQATALITFRAAAAGARTITLTGTDSGGQTCTASIGIVINRNPSVSIDSVTQIGNTLPSFDLANPIDFTGSGTDPDGDAVTLDWVDSLDGAFASGGAVSLIAPAMGRHRVTLTGTDPWGGTATAFTTFDVLPVGQIDLVQPYTTVNNTNGNGNIGRISALGVDPNDGVLAGNNNAEIWAFDATTLAAVPVGFVSPDNVTDILFDPASGMVYLATRVGYYACSYDPVVGLDPNTCTFYQGGDLPSDDVSAIARLTGSNGSDYLVVATRQGLLIADNAAGSSTGTVVLDGIDLRSMAADGTTVWIGSRDDGLYHVDPVTGAVLGQWKNGNGLPSNRVDAVAVGNSGVWAGTDKGLAHLDVATNSITVWVQSTPPAPGLVDNAVQALTLDQTNLTGVLHEVLWIGTRNGVSRFDPTIPSFMNLGTADGLPSADVRSVAILSDGTKIFGTNNGIARYTGP